MMFYPPHISEAAKDLCADSSITMWYPDIVNFPILPNFDNRLDPMDQLSVEPLNSDFQYDNMQYPEGNKDCMMIMQGDYNTTQTSGWRYKKLNEWNGDDTVNWITEMGKNKDIKVSRLSLYSFKDVRGIELVQMSRTDFINKIKPDFNSESNIESAGEDLYEEVKRLENQLEQDSVVPVTVMDRGLNYEEHYLHSSDNPQFIDLDDHQKQIAIDSRSDLINVMNCDSGYVSLTEEHEYKMEDGLYCEDQDLMIDNTLPVVIAKRPPGRPKGSGKKPQKRVKNVSVPEFLRDLLHDRNYCPRIIKWEDYGRGKFRFICPNEVAKLWGLKKNNKKMSFEKFSRAMRYHYKQGVLVSVPSARLVYQFGPKAPSYGTSNPNFECNSEFSMR